MQNKRHTGAFLTVQIKEKKYPLLQPLYVKSWKKPKILVPQEKQNLGFGTKTVLIILYTWQLFPYNLNLFSKSHKHKHKNEADLVHQVIFAPQHQLNKI